MLYGLEFAHPKMGYWLLGALFLTALFFFAGFQRKKTLLTFAEESSLGNLLYLEKRTHLRSILSLLCVVAVIFALMEPQKLKKSGLLSDSNREALDEKWAKNDNQEKSTVRRIASDVIFLVDTSASMSICDTRTQISRLEYAKEIIDDIISKLDGQNVSLYAFTSKVTPLVPPTMDYVFTRLLTKNISINEGDVAGTDLVEALEYLKKKALVSDSKHPKTLIIFTDGGDTYLESLDPSEKKKQTALFLEKTKPLFQEKVKCFTIGLGSPEGATVPNVTFEGRPIISSLDTSLLKSLSQIGHGHYFFANAYSAPQMSECILEQIKKDQITIEEEKVLEHKLLRTSIEKNPNPANWNRFFQFPLTLAIIFLMFELLLPLLPLKQKVSLDE